MGKMKKLSMVALLSIGLSCASAFAASENTTLPSLTNSETDMQAIAMKNKEAGEAFLAANKKKTGVVTLADGLQYKILTEGTGQKPTASDSVTVNYAGTLIDGTEFDSSYKRGEPITFPVNGVIAGWTEALKLMPVGSTWELYIPSELAYGKYGAGPQIGPNAVLIFKVELLDIKK
jgi:FKBP-type peptidyl-prolyl cis-trans isomerase FklB